MKYLIAGLGNIGAEYRDTRHNIGFNIADALAADAGAQFHPTAMPMWRSLNTVATLLPLSSRLLL